MGAELLLGKLDRVKRLDSRAAALAGDDDVQWPVVVAAGDPSVAGNDDVQWPAVVAASGPSVELICGSRLKPESVEWLWPGWLATGKFHVFGGAPGTGKTTIAMSLAATVTCGGRWPDFATAQAGNVVIWSGEDDPADTLVPRLLLSGADLSRVFFVSDVREGDGRRSFDPARDIEPLRRKLTEIGGVRLLVVDPIVSAVTGDSHKNAEVRRGLQPLVDLARDMRCALLGITHFTKGTSGREPVERLTGSLAFGALARVVLVACKGASEDENGHAPRLFCRAKSNIGPDDGGFEYALEQGELARHPGVFASATAWGRRVEGSARDLLSAAEAVDDHCGRGERDDAKRFLSEMLRDGPVAKNVLKQESDGAGYSWATIRRAKRDLGIEAIKPRGQQNGAWVWRLPGQEQASEILDGGKVLTNREDAQQNCVSTFGGSEHLPDGEMVEVEI